MSEDPKCSSCQDPLESEAEIAAGKPEECADEAEEEEGD